jgi:ribosomal protein S18 acetylase RimI-like enzyme
MEVRHAKKEEVGLLADMCMAVQALHVEIHPSLFQQPTVEQLAEFFGARLADPDFVIFTAWEESIPIGYVMLHVIRKPAHVFIRERQFVEIDHIHVDERHRGQGVGRRLVVESVKLANSLMISNIQLSVWAENHPAVSAFKAMGFMPQRHVMVLENKEWFEQTGSGNTGKGRRA